MKLEEKQKNKKLAPKFIVRLSNTMNNEVKRHRGSRYDRLKSSARLVKHLKVQVPPDESR